MIPARAVNTLGDVMDGDWYVNRHATRRMTIEELQRGPGDANPPAAGTPWQVLVVKTFGVNPGMLVADSKSQLYLLRFDPLGYEGLATGAEMVTSRLFYALGYHVPENYILTIRTLATRGSRGGPGRVQLGPSAGAPQHRYRPVPSARARSGQGRPSAPWRRGCPKGAGRCSDHFKSGA